MGLQIEVLLSTNSHLTLEYVGRRLHYRINISVADDFRGGGTGYAGRTAG